MCAVVTHGNFVSQGSSGLSKVHSTIVAGTRWHYPPAQFNIFDVARCPSVCPERSSAVELVNLFFFFFLS